MKEFKTFEQVVDMLPCMKLPIVVHSKQINENFRVESLEGNYKQGKPGDYLMRGVEGELYICDKAIYEKSYRPHVSVYDSSPLGRQLDMDDSRRKNHE